MSTFAEQSYDRAVDALKALDGEIVALLSRRVEAVRRLHLERDAAGAVGSDPYEVRDIVAWIASVYHPFNAEMVGYLADFLGDFTDEALAE